MPERSAIWFAANNGPLNGVSFLWRDKSQVPLVSLCCYYIEYIRRLQVVDILYSPLLTTLQTKIGAFKLPVLIVCFGMVMSNASIASENGRYTCKNNAPIVFGILPFVSTELLVARFSPLASYLSVKLNVPVRIETAPNFIEFARRTHEEQRYDILFTAPHFYPQAHSKAGFRLIASVDTPGMWAVIVVPRHSQIKTLNDLVGKRLSTVHPAGLATLLVRKHLSDAGIDPDVDVTMISTPSHDASLLSSYHGITDAAALMQPPYAAASPRVRENMRIISKTESTPRIPISVGPRISESCASEISEILLNMATTPEGQIVLRNNKFSGFKKTRPEEYERVRDLLTR